MKRLLVLSLAVIFAPMLSAQEPPKPGPEHDLLKKYVGNWDMTANMGGQESKGTATYKMALGGMWCEGTVDMTMLGMKFEGRSLDSYDATKKKYTGVWCDSFGSSPMVLEGTFDKETKTSTMIGDAPGPDGKLAKHKLVTTWKDDDNFTFSMFVGDGKDPMMTIAYKRKK